MGIRYWCLRLQRFGICLDTMTPFQDRLVGQVQFTRNLRTSIGPAKCRVATTQPGTALIGCLQTQSRCTDGKSHHIRHSDRPVGRFQRPVKGLDHCNLRGARRRAGLALFQRPVKGIVGLVFLDYAGCSYVSLVRALVVVRQSAWYIKTLPTFSDALALVRFQLWAAFSTFQTSQEPPDLIKVSRPLFVSLVGTYVILLDCAKSS